ncbi:hypothetical protein PR048_033490 [Dryococelus australis]|uniref:Ionotropic glutamate receptor L-glutamate and glycine-binding domain-containing protein n=1 Tax=Dryococelus australis TaxID=614101 RepID=A0ABQ9G4K4_9NEOP|nr:hypothetical protein PR048_033490 [Dryococelus australis]
MGFHKWTKHLQRGVVDPGRLDSCLQFPAKHLYVQALGCECTSPPRLKNSLWDSYRANRLRNDCIPVERIERRCDEASGFNINFEFAARALQFMCCLCRTQYIVSPNQGGGMVTEDGCWTGVIGMLQRNETEVGLGELTITKERSLVADFTHIYWERSLYAYVRWPTTSYVSDLNGFAAVMLATIVGATLTQFASMWFLPERGVSKSSIVFEVFYAFRQQGVADNQSPRSRSRSTVLIVTQLAGFFVFSIYSATLMSRLAVQTRTHSYEEFASLVNSTPYSVVYMRGDSSIEMTKPQLQKLNLRNYQLEEDFRDAIERVCNGNYIFVMEDLGPNKKAFSCSADLVTLLLGTSPLSFHLSKNSPYLGVGEDAGEWTRREVAEQMDQRRVLRPTGEQEHHHDARCALCRESDRGHRDVYRLPASRVAPLWGGCLGSPERQSSARTSGDTSSSQDLWPDYPSPVPLYLGGLEWAQSETVHLPEVSSYLLYPIFVVRYCDQFQIVQTLHNDVQFEAQLMPNGNMSEVEAG